MAVVLGSRKKQEFPSEDMKIDKLGVSLIPPTKSFKKKYSHAVRSEVEISYVC